MADWIGVDVADATRATACGHDPYYAKGMCRKCYNADWALNHRERRRETAAAWRAANPDRHQQVQRAWREANAEHKADYARAWAEANAEQHARKKAAWREANREHERAYTRAWAKANPLKVKNANNRYRALKRGLGCDLTAEQWEAILLEFGHRCAYCEQPDLPLLMEHMTPLSRGGLHTATNVVPACQPCNSRKSTKTAEEFAGWSTPPLRSRA